MGEIYQIKVTDISGQNFSLSKYKGKVLLIVNVASQCGFTPQYSELEELYKIYKDRGLEIFAFPCNQFGGQEPGNEAEIKNFCTTNYSVSFPLFAKIDVNGKNEHPLYTHLKKSAKGILGTEAIKWNFTKFLVDKNGQVVSRHAPTKSPKELSKEIESLLS